MKLGFAESLLFNTIRIEAKNLSGEIVTGTAFLFEFNVLDKEVPCLVTNKHVVKDTTSATIYLHTLKDDRPDYGNKQKCILDDFESSWLFHPDDVDVSCR